MKAHMCRNEYQRDPLREVGDRMGDLGGDVRVGDVGGDGLMASASGRRADLAEG